MENTPSTNKPASRLQTVAETVRSNTEHTINDMSSRAKEIASDTTENASRYYNQASAQMTGWMRENYGLTLGAVGILALGGLFGFFLGRSNRNSVEL